MVRVPYWRARSASLMTCLISLMPARTAENSMKSALVMRAMILARVVLPVPGGPQKIIDVGSSCSICTRNGFPGPTRCSCPTNSSSVRGRIRSASGRAPAPAGSSFGMGANRFTRVYRITKLPAITGHCRSSPVLRGFVQYDAGGHSGVQRFHLIGLRDGYDFVDLPHNFARKPGAFVADEDCQR